MNLCIHIARTTNVYMYVYVYPRYHVYVYVYVYTYEYPRHNTRGGTLAPSHIYAIIYTDHDNEKRLCLYICMYMYTRGTTPAGAPWRHLRRAELKRSPDAKSKTEHSSRTLRT